MRLSWLLLFCPALAFAQGCPSISRKLENIMDRHVEELRGVKICRMAKSSENVEVVLYVIEGPCAGQEGPPGSCGNIHNQYLAAIVNSKPVAPFEVVGFSVDEMAVQGSKISLKGKALGKNDPRCCPSVDTERTLTVTENGFK